LNWISCKGSASWPLNRTLHNGGGNATILEICIFELFNSYRASPCQVRLPREWRVSQATRKEDQGLKASQLRLRYCVARTSWGRADFAPPAIVSIACSFMFACLISFDSTLPLSYLQSVDEVLLAMSKLIAAQTREYHAWQSSSPMRLPVDRIPDAFA